MSAILFAAQFENACVNKPCGFVKAQNATAIKQNAIKPQE